MIEQLEETTNKPFSGWLIVCSPKRSSRIS